MAPASTDGPEPPTDTLSASLAERPPELLPADLLARFVDSISAGVCIWDDDLRLVACNRAFVDLLGVADGVAKPGARLAEILNASTPVLDDTHTGEDLERLGRKLLATDGKLALDRVLTDGRIISISYDAFAPGGWIAIYRDVTDRQQRRRDAERELKTQNTRLDAALGSMPYGFSIWDDDYRLVLFNARYPEMYGMPRDRIYAGMSLLEICELTIAVGNHPDVMPDELFRRYRDRLRENTDPARVGHYQKSIRERTIKASYTCTPGLGWVITHEDVTDDIRRVDTLRARERQLEQQNMRFHAAVENMSQGLCLFDADKRLVICNANYARMYRVPPELVQPGTLLTDILAHRIENGMHPINGRDGYFERTLDIATDAKPVNNVVEFADGRVISIIHQPLPDGGWVATHQDITEQRSIEDRIRHLARHDSLTDLPNRLMFLDTMHAAEKRVADRKSFAVLAIDLDHFKAVNDTLGHAVGDTVLKMVSDRLRTCCREGDFVARLGGDEFAVLSGTLTNPDDAAVLAERIVGQTAEPFVIEGHNVAIGASVGIAVAPGDGTDTDTLLRNADLALYRAKQEGRGAYHFFEMGMDAALQQRRALELALRRALYNDEFRLVFQPLINLPDNRVCGVEALLRWYHPEKGTIAPADFIPIAEDSGLIVPIGEWVLREACAAATAWPQEVNIAVNLSVVQFRDRNFPETVRSALDHSGLDPARLELEVTESLLLADREITLGILNQLRELGVRISIDDFGTGYSSMSYLRSFPFDKIKIDQSFVHDLAAGNGSRAIVDAVIAIARSMGMSTTAEGVETQDQLDLIRLQGCTEAQGFLFSPPLPSSAIDKLFDGSDPQQVSRAALDRTAVSSKPRSGD